MSAPEDEEIVWSVDWGSLPAADSVPAEPDLPREDLVPIPVDAPLQATQTDAPLSQNLLTPGFQALPHIPSSQQPAKSLVRGQRLKLSDVGLPSEFEIAIRIGCPNGLVVDVTCLGLDSQDRLSDERYFVFFNQKQSPCGAITLQGSSEDNLEVVAFALEKLPSTINRLIVVAAIDGEGKMADLGDCSVSIRTRDCAFAEFLFSGRDLGDETTLMMVEVYRKDGIWRIAALGQGFAGGLAPLLKHFGATLS